MTQEEKARAYDEALNRADSLTEKYGGREFAEYVFPELAESEDERIRKELKEAFEAYDIESTWNGIPIRSIFAWLEKRKENIEKEYVFRPLAGTDINTAILQAIRRANEGEHLVLAFNGAYIPVRKGCNANKIVDIYDTFIEKQKEQKPAEWDEFDEDCLKRAIWYIENPAPSVVKDTNLVLWLKAIPGRFYLQPKEELSIEKAIQWLDDTFYFLDNSSGRGRDCEITTHDFDSLEEMYDSFRKAVTIDSQPHWKPSEEQMEALKETLETYKGFEEYDAVKSLYNDLKKLRVEEEPEYYQHFDPDC